MFFELWLVGTAAGRTQWQVNRQTGVYMAGETEWLISKTCHTWVHWWVFFEPYSKCNSDVLYQFSVVTWSMQSADLGFLMLMFGLCYVYRSVFQFVGIWVYPCFSCLFLLLILIWFSDGCRWGWQGAKGFHRNLMEWKQVGPVAETVCCQSRFHHNVKYCTRFNIQELIIIIITTTIFIVLSSWPGHCESSLGSSGECRTAPSGRRPSDQATWLGLQVRLF